MMRAAVLWPNARGVHIEGFHRGRTPRPRRLWPGAHPGYPALCADPAADQRHAVRSARLCKLPAVRDAAGLDAPRLAGLRALSALAAVRSSASDQRVLPVFGLG